MLTLFEAVCAGWTKDPEAFIINPRHLIPQPNTQFATDLAPARSITILR